MNDKLRTGDVALDLAQGQPVHILENTHMTAEAWSDANNYDLLENYGNQRLGTDPTDCVFDVVYCSNAKGKPSRTYAMPESRLLRVETEKADDGPQVYQRIVREVLQNLMAALMNDNNPAPGRADDLAEAARCAGYAEDIVTQAWELADVDQTI